MSRQITKSTIMYMIFYAVEKLFFLSIIFLNQNFQDISLSYFLFHKLENTGIFISIVEVVQEIIETAGLAVLTSFYFAYILNKQPNIIFPDKLVVRHRTSWESKNKLTLGILIGNKSHFNIHNITCSITCSYIKKENPLLINSEFTMREERILLENYYRFSFDLAQFPRKVLKDIVEKPAYYGKETISVSLSGQCNYIGNSFKMTKMYKLSDIVYDEHTPILTEIRKNILTGKDLINPLTKKNITKIKWDELNHYIEVGEEKRSRTVNEIYYIIKNKKKIKKKNV